MASDIPVRIDFFADAGNVESVARDLKNDLAGLAQTKVPKLTLDVDLDAQQVFREFGAIEEALPPLNLGALSLDTSKIFEGIGQVEGALEGVTLPPLEFPAPKGLDKAAVEAELFRREVERLGGVDLTSIKNDLNAILNTPNLNSQAQGYSQILNRLNAWKTANAEVAASSKALQTVLASMTRSAQEGLQRVADRARSLADMGQQLALGFAGVGTVFGGLATGAVLVASNFEQLRARLVTVTGSAVAAGDAFAYAQELAAKSPFDVEAMVAATASLEAFELKARELLPVVANLAAGRGVSLQEAALVFSKAASGSAEGFESLRNEYGITTRALLEFGAAQGEVAGTLSNAGKDIERNRDALIRIINTRFGDAIARQAQTFAGAMSNASDSAKNLAADFGSTLLPILTFGARTFSLVVDAANKIPTGAKAAIAGLVAIGGAVGLMGGALIGGVTGLLLLQATLATTAATLATEVPAAAALATAGVDAISAAGARASLIVGGLQSRLIAARTAALAFAATPIGAALLALSGITLLLNNELNKFRDNQARLGDEIAQSSNRVASANRGLRQSINAINEAGRETGVSVDRVRDSGEQLKLVMDAILKLSPEALTTGLAVTGQNTKTLKADFDALTESAKKQQVEVNKLATEIENLINVQRGLNTKTGIIPQDREKAEELRKKLAEAKAELEKIQNQAKITKSELDKVSEFEKGLQKVIDGSKNLQTFLDLSRQVGTAEALAGALSAVNQQIQANAATSGINTDNLDRLLQQFSRTDVRDTQKREALQAQIKLVQQRGDLEQAEKARQDKILDEQLSAQDLALRRRRALGQTRLEDELSVIEAQLALVQQGSEREISLLEAKSAKIKEIQQRDLEAAQKAFQDLQAANQSGLDQSRDGDQRGVVAAIDQAINRTAAWRQANLDLIQQYPEIATELQKIERSQGLDRQRELAKLAKDNLQELAAVLGNQLADAANNSEKLAVTQNAIAQIQRARRTGLIDEQGAQQQLNQLTRNKLQLEQQIAQEKRQQEEAIKQQQAAGLSQDIQILEARREAGENSKQLETELTEARKRSVQEQLDAVERQRQEELQRGADAVLSEQLAAQKRDQILKAETLRRFQEQQKQTNDVKTALDEQERLHRQHFTRLGGMASPLQSAEEAFGGPGAFSFGPAFSLNTPRPRPRQNPVSFRQTADSVTRDFQPVTTGAIGAANAGAAAAAGSIYNVTNSFNGVPFVSPEFTNAVKDVMLKLQADTKLRGR